MNIFTKGITTGPPINGWETVDYEPYVEARKRAIDEASKAFGVDASRLIVKRIRTDSVKHVRTFVIERRVRKGRTT